MNPMMILVLLFTCVFAQSGVITKDEIWSFGAPSVPIKPIVSVVDQKNGFVYVAGNVDGVDDGTGQTSAVDYQVFGLDSKFRSNSYSTTTEPVLSGENVYLIKIKVDTNEIVWWSLFGGPNQDEVTSMVLDKDGNIIVTGNALDNWEAPYLSSHLIPIYYVLKLDSEGTALKFTFGPSTKSFQSNAIVYRSSDNTIWMAGVDGDSMLNVVGFSSNLAVINTFSFGSGYGPNFPFYIFPYNDGVDSLIVGGFTQDIFTTVGRDTRTSDAHDGFGTAFLIRIDFGANAMAVKWADWFPSAAGQFPVVNYITTDGNGYLYLSLWDQQRSIGVHDSHIIKYKEADGAMSYISSPSSGYFLQHVSVDFPLVAIKEDGTGHYFPVVLDWDGNVLAQFTESIMDFHYDASDDFYGGALSCYISPNRAQSIKFGFFGRMGTTSSSQGTWKTPVSSQRSMRSYFFNAILPDVTTSLMTTAVMTTQAMTTQELTTQQMTTGDMTTAVMTTNEMTTFSMTTAEITTGEMTTSVMTTNELTTLSMTTSEMTTAEITSAEVTSAEMTTASLTTASLTTSSMTTAGITTGIIVSDTLDEFTLKTSTQKFTTQFIGQTVIPTKTSPANSFTYFALSKSSSDYAIKTIYVLTVPYSGSPLTLSSETAGYFAKATTKNKRVWLFNDDVKFVAGTTYYFYITTAVDITLDIGVESRRANAKPYLLYDGNTWQQAVETLVYKLVSTSDGKAVGDPYFIGFNHQMFEFDGHISGIYNIYNDPWMNLNSQFGMGNKENASITIMKTLGLTIGGHNIMIDRADRISQKKFKINIDGEDVIINPNVRSLSGCIDIQYKDNILITSPLHSVYLYPKYGRSKHHINLGFFDIHIHHPDEDLSKIGGVLGQTAKADNVISLEESTFEIDALFGTEESHFFEDKAFECEAN